MKIQVINGPNLNLLGKREPEIYGSITLDEINKMLEDIAIKNNIKINFFQSNHEGEIIDKIHQCIDTVDYIIINAGAYTHYSYAIRDAIKGTEVPTIEVHMSDINKREEFRKISVIEDVCIEQIMGFGYKSYIYALEKIINKEV